MSENKSKPKSQTLAQTIVLLAVLIILPAGSWLYLRTGLDYRKNLKEELGDFGKIGNFELDVQNGKRISNEDIKGKVVVAHFLPPNKTEAKEIIQNRIFKVEDPFKDYKGVVFLSHFASESEVDLWKLSNELGLVNQKNWFLVGGNGAELENHLANTYRINNKNGQSVYGQVVITDTSHTIRNYYNIDSDAELGRLIEHIVLLTPEKEE